VIVRYFDIVSILLMPHEANPILVVDPDAVLPMPVSLEFFQPIAGRNSEIVPVPSRIQQRKFSFGDPGGRRPSGLARSPDFRRFCRGETLNHASIVTIAVNNVNRYYPGQAAGRADRASAMLYSFPK
jgi:hypothetical protein